MPIMPFARHLAAATSALLALSATSFSQDVSGTITGAYNADDAVWTVSPGGEGDLPASGWMDRENDLLVTLVGTPGEEGMYEDGTLVLSFTMTGGPQELRVVEPSVTMTAVSDGADVMAGPDRIDMQVTALERTDETLAIAGDIVATLTPGGLGDITIESDDAILIDGNFQATLTRLETED